MKKGLARAVSRMGVRTIRILKDPRTAVLATLLVDIALVTSKHLPELLRGSSGK